MPFLEGRVNFFFNFCITLQCHEAWFVFTFSSKSIWKNACGNIAKFFMSFLKAQISCHSSSASILSAIKHDSSVLFQLKHYILWSKEPIRMLRSKFWSIFLARNKPPYLYQILMPFISPYSHHLLVPATIFHAFVSLCTHLRELPRYKNDH